MKTKITASNTKAFTAASAMPELSHWRDRSQPWSPAQSDVLAWLISQPEIASFLLSKMANAGVLTYIPAKKTWVGTRPAWVASTEAQNPAVFEQSANGGHS
jgi:hypothetical protein